MTRPLLALPIAALRVVVRLALAAALSLGLLVPSAFVTGDARAQERQRPNLLDVLRGKPRRVTPPRDARRVRRVTRPAPRRATTRRAAKPAARRAPKRATKRATRRTAPKRAPKRTATRRAKPAIRKVAPAAPVVAEVEKADNAAKVLVIGDFLAGGLADGLEAAFTDSPGVVVVDASNGSSGLVRDDHYDWAGELPGLIAKHEPRVVAVQLGSNDGQPMRVDGETLRERTDEWSAAYAARAESLASLIEASGAELVWIGAPAFRSRSLTADMVRFNEHFTAATEKAGGAFVDVWEGFVDQNGAYMRSGPDVNGQVVRLRGQDGINLTRAGRRKMAFFAEKDVRAALGGMDAEGFGSISGIELPPIGDDLLAAPLQPRMSPPIPLGDLESEPAVELAETVPTGAVPAPPREAPASLLVPDDGAVPAQRADNFAWPPNG